MKLKSFHIKNIKSIVDSGVCYISDSNITIFAGQNESGKSAVLEALKYFSNGPDENFKKYSMRINGGTPYVECCFALCDENDLNYKDENVGMVLKELKEILCYREDEDEVKFSSTTNSKLIEIISQLSKKHKITNIKDEPEVAAVAEEETTDAKVTVEEFAKHVEESVLKYLPSFDYYNSFDNILPEEIAISDIANNEAVQDFQTVFNIDLSEFVKMQTNLKVQKRKDVVSKFGIDFNECWTQKLTNFDDSKYELIIEDKDNKIEFLIDRGTNTPLYLLQKSTGFRWFLSFYLRLMALKTKIENGEIEDYILLIDEPGQGLHEKAQEDVKKVLEELSQTMQILYTTHNPRLINVEDKITRLRLIYHDQIEGTKINTLPQMASKGTKQSLGALAPIVTAMGLVNMSCINLSNNKNVIVEGITDKYYLEAFIKLLNIEFEYNIIPSCGCENIKNIANILLGWGYDFKVIIDGGEGRNPQENKTEKIIREKLFAYNEDIANKKIKRLSQCAIEDCFSNNDFINYVKPEDIEHTDLGNSAIAKQYGKKELWARLFIEKVNNDEIHQADLEQETINNFEEILSWIQESNN